MPMNRIDLVNHRLHNESFSEYRDRRLTAQWRVKIHLKGRMIWEAVKATMIHLTKDGIPTSNVHEAVKHVPVITKVKGTYSRGMDRKLGRNELCTCGSNIKAKKCNGKPNTRRVPSRTGV